MIDRVRLKTRKLVNALQSVLLIALMALLTGVLGWRIAGPDGLVVAVIVIALSMLFNPTLSPGLVLRLFDARPLPPGLAPTLYEMIEHLARRAGLAAAPGLYYLPNPQLNAFTIGAQPKAAIVVTDGLLRALDRHELYGVLAHEISHIRHNDTWVVGRAELFSRMTAVFSLTGQLLLLINLPLFLFTDMAIDWLTINYFWLMDAIKIDQGFVRRMRDDDYSRKIVTTVMGLAGAIGAEVVAEGVEDAATRDALLELGCRLGQGYYYSMPLEAEDFRWLLEQRSALPLAGAGG